MIGIKATKRRKLIYHGRRGQNPSRWSRRILQQDQRTRRWSIQRLVQDAGADPRGDVLPWPSQNTRDGYRFHDIALPSDDDLLTGSITIPVKERMMRSAYVFLDSSRSPPGHVVGPVRRRRAGHAGALVLRHRRPATGLRDDPRLPGAKRASPQFDDGLGQHRASRSRRSGRGDSRPGDSPRQEALLGPSPPEAEECWRQAEREIWREVLAGE